MESREEATVGREPFTMTSTDEILYEIALSLGRIADLLADMNGYPVDSYLIERRDKNEKR